MNSPTTSTEQMLAMASKGVSSTCLEAGSVAGVSVAVAIFFLFILWLDLSYPQYGFRVAPVH